MPAIYLVRLSPGGFSGPPSGMGRATLLTPVYMTLQLPRRTALASPQGRWALTPPSHPCRRAGARRRLFSSALLHPRGWLSVRKWDALCCPDFPPAPVVQAADRPTASPGAKVRKQIGAAKGCRKSLSKLSRQVLVKSLFIPYPSLISLLFLSFTSVSSSFQVCFFFVWKCGWYGIEMGIAVAWFHRYVMNSRLSRLFLIL